MNVTLNSAVIQKIKLSPRKTSILFASICNALSARGFLMFIIYTNSCYIVYDGGILVNLCFSSLKCIGIRSSGGKIVGSYLFWLQHRYYGFLS